MKPLEVKEFTPSWKYVPGKSSSIHLLSNVNHSLECFAETLKPQEKVALQALLDLAVGDVYLNALGAKLPQDILNPEEITVYKNLCAQASSTATSMRGQTVMIMKATRLCNLRCTYCRSWREGPDQVMTFPVLAHAIRDSLQAVGASHIEFVWHGGEVTLLPTAFYLKATPWV
jgi:uncharacterized protein